MHWTRCSTPWHVILRYATLHMESLQLRSHAIHYSTLCHRMLVSRLCYLWYATIYPVAMTFCHLNMILVTCRMWTSRTRSTVNQSWFDRSLCAILKVADTRRGETFTRCSFSKSSTCSERSVLYFHCFKLIVFYLILPCFGSRFFDHMLSFAPGHEEPA